MRSRMGMAALLLGTAFSGTAGCDKPEEEAVPDLGSNGEVSDCGGFNAAPEGPPPPSPDSETCGDDQLSWSHDAESEVLSLTNTGVFLNCCGEHDITVTLEDETYVVTEVDDPEVYAGEELRCSCMCLFDYSVDIEDIATGEFSMRIVREVSDNSPSTWTAWEGTLDLSAGSGEVLIEADVGWCDEE